MGRAAQLREKARKKTRRFLWKKLKRGIKAYLELKALRYLTRTAKKKLGRKEK